MGARAGAGHAAALNRPAASPGEGKARFLSALARRAFAPVDIASLACFRVAFGAVMAWEVVRYFQNRWIASYYIEPEFHFTYYGFGWVGPWPGAGMYVHFAMLGLAAVGIMIGVFYRLSAVVFFLGFTYVFLLDQARYLNHFYLIALLSFLLVFLPVRGALTVDARRRPELRSDWAPAWGLWLLRAQVGIPYFYAGVAKINGDWLRGEPLRAWLADRTEFPLLGRYFAEEWMVLAFAHGAMLLDLLIVPLLMWRASRPWAFGLGLLFHGLNAALFDIGVFPWLMMAATTIFFAPDWPRRLRLLPTRRPRLPDSPLEPSALRTRATLAAIGAYLVLQVIVPLRHFAYPGNVSWTEEGHRFSWHMKLRDKEATARFLVTDPAEGLFVTVKPSDYLARWQSSKMATQPDMILQFAHYLADRLRRDSARRVEVRAWVMASLNGREPQPLIDPTVDLAAQPRSLRPAYWILPLREGLPSKPRTRPAEAEQ